MSTSPYDHSTCGLPIGIRPWSYSAKSSAVHFSGWTTSGPGGDPAQPARVPRCCPRRAGSGPSGRRLSSGRRRTGDARTRCRWPRSRPRRSLRRRPRRPGRARQRKPARCQRPLGHRTCARVSPRSVTVSAGAGLSSRVVSRARPPCASAALVSQRASPPVRYGARRRLREQHAVRTRKVFGPISAFPCGLCAT